MTASGIFMADCRGVVAGCLLVVIREI